MLVLGQFLQVTNAVQYVEMPPSLQQAYNRFSCTESCLSGLSSQRFSTLPSLTA